MDISLVGKFSIGLATFLESNRQEIEGQLMEEQIIEAFDEQNFCKYGEGIASSFTKLMRYIKECDFESMTLYQLFVLSNEPDILVSSASCKFNNLTAIYLCILFYYEESDNLTMKDVKNLSNIEAVAFLDMPHLQEAYFQFNFISQSKSLDKTNWPKLLDLSIDKNYISHLDLSRLRTVKNSNEAVVYHSSIITTPSQDVSSIAKIQRQDLLFLMLDDHKERIDQVQTKNSLKRKYPNIAFKKQDTQQQED